MRSNYDVAELLVASWKIANGSERMPTSHGILDAALRELIKAQHNDLPAWFAGGLTFADTRVGLRCLELPAILDCAQESCLTSEPNSSYVTTAIKADDIVCRSILMDLEVDIDLARTWGEQLKAATDRIVREDHERPAIIEAA